MTNTCFLTSCYMLTQILPYICRTLSIGVNFVTLCNTLTTLTHLWGHLLNILPHHQISGLQECSSTQLKKPAPKPSVWDKLKAVRTKRERVSPPLVRRLRLRGDWSDTGPDARPERDASGPSGVGQARPQLQATLMQRMTDVLSRMLNDPMTRAALSAGGEDSVDADENSQRGLEGGSAGIPGSGGSVETDDGRGEENTEQPVQWVYCFVLGIADVIEKRFRPTSTSEPATPNQTGENSAVTIDLHNHLAALRNLRRGFINQHGSEPSVSFRLIWSTQSKWPIIKLLCFMQIFWPEHVEFYYQFACKQWEPFSLQKNFFRNRQA